MKIPASSSLILATLAISSSSASLAAPTGDGTAEGSLSQIRSQAEPPHHANQAMENEGTDGGLTARDLGELDPRDVSDLSTVLRSLPLVGPILEDMFNSQCPNPNDPSAQADNAPDPAELQRIQDAVSTMSSALAGIMPTGAPISGLPVAFPTGAPVPLPLSNDDNGVDPNAPGASPSGGPSDATATPAPVAAAADGDGDGSFLISPTTTVANAEEAAPTSSQDPAYLSGAADSGTPTSPGVPAGPPNTPVPAGTAPAST